MNTDVWISSSKNGVRNSERGSWSLSANGSQSVGPCFPEKKLPTIGHMTLTGDAGNAGGRPSLFPRSYSPVGRIPSPPVLSHQMTVLQKTRSIGSAESLARDSPDYALLRTTSSGPMDESTCPSFTADRAKDWHTIFQENQKVNKQDNYISPTPSESQMCQPPSKNKSNNGTSTFREPCPPPRALTPTPSPTPQHRERVRERATPEINKWRPSDKKADVQRVESRNIFDYEGGGTATPEQDITMNDLLQDDIDLENEPWYKFFDQLEFGRPPPKKQLDYSAENSPHGLLETFLYWSTADKHQERPSSLVSEYPQRRQSDPLLSHQGSLGDRSSIQASWQPVDPHRSGSALMKEKSQSLPSPPKAKELDTYRTSLPVVGKHMPQKRQPVVEKQKIPARALYDFTAHTAKELSFRKGERLYIIRQVDRNWYEGEQFGQLGIFPVSYVEKVQSAPKRQEAKPRPPTPMTDIGEAVACHNFTADSSMELPLRKGEKVLLLRQVDQNWFEGKNVETNQRGIFPVSYVRITDKSSTKGPSRYAEPSLIQNYPAEGTHAPRSSKAAMAQPRLRTPSPTPKQSSLHSPSPAKAHLPAAHSSWTSLTAALSPSSTPAPTPPPFPTGLLPGVALDHPECLSPHGRVSALRDGQFIPITSAWAPRFSPELSSSPNLACRSYPPSPVSPMFDYTYKYSSGDLAPPRLHNEEEDCTEPPVLFKPSSYSNLAASEPIRCSALSEVLSSFKGQEEDVCEEILSFIQEGQAKSEHTKEDGLYTETSDVTEELPKLYIEEDPCENIKHDKDFNTIPSSQQESSIEEVSASLSNTVDISSSALPSNQQPTLSHVTASKAPPPSPCSTPPLPAVPQAQPVVNRHPPRQDPRSPKPKPAFRRDIVVVGKPPRSPVMSRRSCGSPVRGQSFSPSHRRPALGQDFLQSGGESFQVLYNYTPHNEDELELIEGDIVDVMEKCDDGWFVGTSRRTKLFGTFPGNYVKRL